ncbi:hypothetical protein PtrSN002B_003419 [Pyrenophora tritici-repentis]|uniref:Uncharacterized protein n=2 Tax=Pyrenophora tritici-repentis TaxID=45151 RepID=A0A2W1EV19_9PLEO|nr:uncharacterized protein PTRG_06168 [Pyrenophora tritici-repentis Pt-1C-BFP]KAA8619299.1 hypothetical protein PtrV1_08728 [Pyrenophora tritici-repentis]EDU49088.1 predicted protein [Pyrenophora tritici-repentis Pt-1C-BFP]KAF7449771.1 hypothetical protein A1F99_068200 [Pyrenophora tritici-repentis]KAF7570102.1 hypothetical protein PtrM4_101040 [Pyrenophora tritici-repentis]KAG9383300.1 hypothetical protein A1F94_005211 [Pyrenophora tritici-repentis]
MPPSTYTLYANPSDNIPYPSSSTRLPVPHGLYFLCTGLLALGLWYTFDHLTFRKTPSNEDAEMDNIDGIDGERKTKIVVVFDDVAEIEEVVKEIFRGLDEGDAAEE